MVVADGCPAPAWQLRLHMRGAGQMDLEAVGDGAAHQFEALGTVTADWTAGTHWWAVRAESDGDLVELARGQIEILPDITAAEAGFDGRSENEKALDAINAVLGKRATIDQERYRINNRELYRMSVKDLLKLRDHFVKLVARERGKSVGGIRLRPLRLRR